LLDLVADGVTGIHVPPGDVGALRDALKTLLADRDLRHRLGEAGRERVRERFSWAAVTDSTIAAYGRASGKRP
jgi:glycosyltransferase involved in cell wall biosynthesis